jgi:hypothetical protein
MDDNIDETELKQLESEFFKPSSKPKKSSNWAREREKEIDKQIQDLGGEYDDTDSDNDDDKKSIKNKNDKKRKKSNSSDKNKAHKLSAIKNDKNKKDREQKKLSQNLDKKKEKKQKESQPNDSILDKNVNKTAKIRIVKNTEMNVHKSKKDDSDALKENITRIRITRTGVCDSTTSVVKKTAITKTKETSPNDQKQFLSKTEPNIQITKIRIGRKKTSNK